MIHSIFKSAVESVMPDPTGNYLETHGTLSPNQFVEAGDIFISKCKSWNWESGHPDMGWSFLPKDKQYLITRNVKSNRIIDKQVYKEHIVNETSVEDDWTVTEHINTFNNHQPIETSIIETSNIETSTIETSNIETSNIEDSDSDLEIDDHDSNILITNNHQIETRTYDIYITYDKYYQTPRIGLFGYNYDNMPLGFKEMMDDIESEYVNRTVTYENHPHIPLMVVSIHPCRHSHVMKKIMMGYKKMDLDNYLNIFLKFISSIIPNINYDHTTNN